MNIFKKKKGPSDLVSSTKKHIDILAATGDPIDPAIFSSSNNNEGGGGSGGGGGGSSSSATASSSSSGGGVGGSGPLPSLKNFDEKTYKKSLEKVSNNLSQMKLMLYGDGENDPKEEEIIKLITEILSNNLLELLLANMKRFEFEARKDCAQIYSYILRHRKTESVDYLKHHSSLIKLLVEGYNDNEIALNCGAILREVIRHEELAQLILYDDKLFDRFYDFVQLNTFDIASDAFATFKLLLTKHKTLCAKFLETTFEPFCKKYSVLLMDGNYVTKRQSLKLLGEILLNRSNFNVMMKFINSAENLKIMMNLLRGTTKAIQFEAFHVFKIFVANPRKSPAVTEILYRNRTKLIDFLNKFQKDKDEEQFNEEKSTLIRTLHALQPPPGMEHLANEENNNNNNEEKKRRWINNNYYGGCTLII